MTALRQKMIEDMQLRGFAFRTQEAYLLGVRQLARYYNKSPDLVTEDELRQFFLFLKNVKHAAHNTCTIALCGIKFFFQHTLGREWKTFDFLRPPPTLSGLPDPYLCLWTALAGRGPFTSYRDRWGTQDAPPASWKRQQRSLCATASRLFEDAAALPANPS